MAEGGASEWSAKLVRDDLAGTAALGAIADAVFSVGMGAGRLLADRLWARWGAGGLLRRSGVLAALGFAAGLGVGTVPSAIAAFAALGVGLAGVIPTLFRAGADHPGVSTGPALAAVSSLGYLGFLAGPPVIGAVAQFTSLRMACGVLVLAGVIVLLLAPVADGQPGAPAPEVLNTSERRLKSAPQMCAFARCVRGSWHATLLVSNPPSRARLKPRGDDPMGTPHVHCMTKLPTAHEPAERPVTTPGQRVASAGQAQPPTSRAVNEPPCSG